MQHEDARSGVLGIGGHPDGGQAALALAGAWGPHQARAIPKNAGRGGSLEINRAAGLIYWRECARREIE